MTIFASYWPLFEVRLPWGILAGQRPDRVTENVPWNMGDLARIEDDSPALDHEMRADVAVWQAKLLGGQEWHDDTPR